MPFDAHIHRYKRQVVTVIVALIALLAGIGLSAGVALAGLPADGSKGQSLQEAPVGSGPQQPASTLGGCGLSWRAIGSPNVGSGPNVLRAIASVSTNDVWAVGYYYNSSGVARTLTTRWNGTSWSIIPSPNPSTDTDSALLGISALSGSNVWAVGYNGSQTLLMHWDGAAWSVVPSPSVPSAENYLNSITAISSNDVWAVGYSATASNDGRTLILHWDGVQWSIVSSPNGGFFANELYAVTAVAANDVWALGRKPGGAQDETLALHWDGISWSVEPSSAPAGSHSAVFLAADAVSENDVWAVGSFYGTPDTLVGHWDGTQWEVAPGPRPTVGNIGASELFGVSAISSNDVWAVGYYIDNGVDKTLTAHLNGSQWSIVPSANPLPEGNRLYAVDGTSSNDVWAVGSQGSVTQQEQRTLVERYNDPCATATLTPTGTPPTATSTRTSIPTPTCITGWSTDASPNIDVNSNRLNAVAVASQTEAWAVGYFLNIDGVEQTLTLKWDGTTWSVVPSPSVSATGHNRLTGVTALAPNNVWAVGYYYLGGIQQTLTMRWDGTQWNLVSSPNPGASGNALFGVDASGANDVWAVGNYTGDMGPQSLTLHWDGTAWEVVPSPNPPGPGNYLVAVDAVAQDQAWAVGYSTSLGDGATLILRWNGSQWSEMPSPNPGEHYDDRLRGVVALADDNVWATGHYFFNGVHRTLILHWDGAQWTHVSTPNAGTGNNGLSAVAARSATDIWAAGSYVSGNPAVTRSLAMHWNGTAWGVAPSLNPGSVSNAFFGITIGLLNDVWAVGSYSSTGVERTLIERYRATCATPVATPTGTPPTATATSTRTATPSVTPTGTPTCALQFSDVPQGSTFYPFVRCLACRGILGGYADGTFRPNANVTRGQLSKIVANSAGFNDPVSGQTFEDVPSSNSFYLYVERMSARGIIGGYNCGTVPSEPCGPGNRPYFRPNANATRGQISKIVSEAKGYSDPAGAQIFEDVPSSNTFFIWVQRLASRGIMGGYNCGGAGEPCGPGNRPYFRPNNNATRGQTSKIVANAYFPSCQTPDR